MTRDIAASVRGRLFNQAKKTGRPLQELFQYFAMERFLFRLSRSEHSERFVLKGALMYWASFVRKSKLGNAPEVLAEVISEIAGFLNPIAVAIGTGSSFSAAWTAAGRWNSR